jgi:hypothetical protein
VKSQPDGREEVHLVRIEEQNVKPEAEAVRESRALGACAGASRPLLRSEDDEVMKRAHLEIVAGEGEPIFDAGARRFFGEEIGAKHPAQMIAERDLVRERNGSCDEVPASREVKLVPALKEHVPVLALHVPEAAFEQKESALEREPLLAIFPEVVGIEDHVHARDEERARAIRWVESLSRGGGLIDLKDRSGRHATACRHAQVLTAIEHQSRRSIHDDRVIALDPEIDPVGVSRAAPEAEQPT